MKPLLLDLFCKAGGATRGYQMAGFDVVGVDIEPQPHYRGDWFVQADALTYVARHGQDYDAIHASPPCQFATQLGALHRSKGPDYDAKHANLIPQTRELLRATGKPYVIENVQGARKALEEPVMLCGSMFGLQTKCGAQLQRHRLFETNWLCLVPMKCSHRSRIIGVYGTGMAQAGARTIGVDGGHARDRGEEQRRTIGVHGRPQLIEDRRRVITVTGNTAQQNVVRNQIRKTYTLEQAREAMGIPWMSQAELSQAIPPAYAFYIGQQLREQL